jgi:LmbE family N-acetylglucosaminyl deacetylase
VRLVLLVALLAACGDNQHGEGVPLVQGNDLTVVAHQDDDLLFMQPDLIDLVRNGHGITNIYITAGNGSKGTGTANSRYAGLMAAYGVAANDQNWFCGWIKILGHEAQHCRLDKENVSLVFLAYPDGGRHGELPNSLEKLWEGEADHVVTIADRTTTYTREQLIDTVAKIIDTVHPTTIHTLDLSAAHGEDHPDHHVVGALTALALARTAVEPELVAYRGYDAQSEPANKLGKLFDDTLAVLSYYEACTLDCGVPCGDACPNVQKAHQIWLGRRYAFGFRHDLRGQLRANGQCLAGSTLESCETAPEWVFENAQLHVGKQCLVANTDGSVNMTTCSAIDPAQRFFSDDEGRLWSGLVPDFAPNLTTTFLRCVVPNSDGTVTTAACGGVDTAEWQWSPHLAFTPRASLGFAERGRSVRLGDIDGDGFADLCAVTSSGLACAHGNGDGTFATATVIAQLPVDPQSLTLGDLDGDGVADACGHDAEGVLCVQSSQQFAASRFTSEFATAQQASSLRITDANGTNTENVCGLAQEGVVCSPGGSSFNPRVRSSWPDPTTMVLPADLDGDKFADWCSITPNGPACGLDAESGLTTDGVPWAFTLNKIVDTVPMDPALTDIADIDGDGDGDLCAPPGDGTIGCARSQGHGFGPHATVAVLPDGAVASALWLGDLDGDGRADVCVDLGDQIACAKL